MIDDMKYHIMAWYRILISLGASVSLAQTKQECYGKNSEFLERMLPGVFTDAEKERMGHEKEKVYRDEFRPHLKLLEGLEEFLHQTRQAGVKTAIGSAAIRYNIDFVLDGINIRHLFDAVISGDEVAVSKPHPETFLKCAAAINTKPQDCLVFEDTPKGVESARNARMDCLVMTTMHQPEEFSAYPNVIGFAANYKQAHVSRLLLQQKGA